MRIFFDLRMSRSTICGKCRLTFALEDLRYDSSGKVLLCKKCRKVTPAFPKLIKSDVAEKKAKIKSKYICRKCEHTFEVKPNFKLICPFCSSTQVVNNDYFKDAQSLITDASDKKYDF